MQPKFNFNPFAANNSSKVRPIQSNLRPSSVAKSPRANHQLMSQSLELGRKPLTMQKNALNKSQFVSNGNLSRSQAQLNIGLLKQEPMQSPANKAGVMTNYFNPPKPLDEKEQVQLFHPQTQMAAPALANKEGPPQSSTSKQEIEAGGIELSDREYFKAK